MAVTSPVSFTKIQTEFSPRGVSNNFSDYYKGGTYVKTTDIDPSPFVSSTVAGLAMSQFLDSEYVIPLSVTLDNYNAGGQNIMLSAIDSIYTPGSGVARTTIELNSDGSGTYSTESNIDIPNIVIYSFTWLLSGSASDAYAYMDGPSGDSFSSGSVNSSLQLNTTRIWTLEVLGTGPASKTLTSTLRIKNSGGTDLIAKTISMSVALS